MSEVCKRYLVYLSVLSIMTEDKLRPFVKSDIDRKLVKFLDIVEVGVCYVFTSPACLSRYIILYFCKIVYNY